MNKTLKCKPNLIFIDMKYLPSAQNLIYVNNVNISRNVIKAVLMKFVTSKK